MYLSTDVIKCVRNIPKLQLCIAGVAPSSQAASRSQHPVSFQEELRAVEPLSCWHGHHEVHLTGSKRQLFCRALPGGQQQEQCRRWQTHEEALAIKFQLNMFCSTPQLHLSPNLTCMIHLEGCYLSVPSPAGRRCYPCQQPLQSEQPGGSWIGLNRSPHPLQVPMCLVPLSN